MVEPVWQGAFAPWHQTQQRAHPGRLFTPPPTPTHYLAFCVSLSSVPTCFCLSALLFVCFFLSPAHKDGHSAPALVGGRRNATAAQISCSWRGSAVRRRLRGHCFPSSPREMAGLKLEEGLLQRLWRYSHTCVTCACLPRTPVLDRGV